MKKVLFLIIIIVALIGGGSVYYLFNKKVKGLEKVKADFTITSTKLYDAFETQEQEANTKYLNKILLVEGRVDKVEINNNYSSIILKADNAIGSGINCSFTHEVEGVTNGEMIKIKGRCQGYLMDVVLTNCNIAYE